MEITISLGQFDVKAGHLDHNLKRVEDWTAQAAERGSDVVVFPELWDSGYALDRAADIGTPLDQGRFAHMAELAQTHNIHIISSMMEYVDGRAWNAAVWFTPQGTQAGVYRKIHLFRLMDEDKYLQPGESPLMLDMPWGRTGVSICYDLRFPELYRGYALEGAGITFVPAQWPHPRSLHWRTLGRARAIENQMFVVACNRVGVEGDATFCGYSAIYDPWGEAVVEGDEAEALLTATIDLDVVAKVRNKIPVFEDRRPELYDNLFEKERV